MNRRDFPRMNCSVAQAIDQIGDLWSMLILREAFMGTTRFARFEAHLGLSRSVLASRLAKLVEIGVFETRAAADDRRAIDYCLTPKGEALRPVVLALMLWGDEWTGKKGAPVSLVDRESGEPVAELVALTRAGRPAEFSRLRAAPGPGARRALKQRLAERPPPREQDW